MPPSPLLAPSPRLPPRLWPPLRQELRSGGGLRLPGYARLVAAAAAVGCAFSRPTTTVCLYAAAALCDELDGRVARLAGQCSTFGAVLDMVTDRVSTSALLGVLAVLRPEWALVCLALQALDVASHWFQMQAASLGDSRGGGHKDLAFQRNFVVRLYYRYRAFMAATCVSCEVLYLCLFWLHWSASTGTGGVGGGGGGAVLAGNLLPLLFPGAAALTQPRWCLLLAKLAFPGFVVKQYVNVLQLGQAVQIIVDHDRALLDERRRKE